MSDNSILLTVDDAERFCSYCPYMAIKLHKRNVINIVKIISDPLEVH